MHQARTTAPPHPAPPHPRTPAPAMRLSGGTPHIRHDTRVIRMNVKYNSIILWIWIAQWYVKREARGSMPGSGIILFRYISLIFI